MRDYIKRIFRNIIKKYQLRKILKKQQNYINLTNRELQELSETELYDAIIIRICNKIKNVKSNKNPLNKEEKVVYEIKIYEAEMNNGGLCQFFINSSSLVAPYISDNLKTIKATEHKKLFDNFINKNKIDINDLSSFKIKTYDDIQKKYKEKLKQYPFKEFDSNFYKLPQIQKYLIKYIKNNITKF